MYIYIHIYKILQIFVDTWIGLNRGGMQKMPQQGKNLFDQGVPDGNFLWGYYKFIQGNV